MCLHMVLIWIYSTENIQFIPSKQALSAYHVPGRPFVGGRVEQWVRSTRW